MLASNIGMEPRPFSRQGSIDHPGMYQRSPSVGRMMGGPQYPGGSLQHAQQHPTSSVTKPTITGFHPTTPAFTSQHHHLIGQGRPHFGMCERSYA